MGKSNQSLAKKLGVTESRPYFPNYTKPDCDIYWFYDPIHIIKNVRNHLLDAGFFLNPYVEDEDFVLVGKPHFEELLKVLENSKSDLKIACKLRKLHVHVTGKVIYPKYCKN